jgi:hypothetical protein
VSPAGPDGLDWDPLGYIKDEIAVGVVVVIGAARYRYTMISHFDVFYFVFRN